MFGWLALKTISHYSEITFYAVIVQNMFMFFKGCPDITPHTTHKYQLGKV